MAVQRRIWKPTFWAWPTLPCPSCKVGTLKIDKNTISKDETTSSKAAHHLEGWTPELVSERFIAILTCANPSCGDKVFVCGEMGKELDYDTDPDGKMVTELYEYCIPHFFEPAPPVFPVPNECPKKVRNELEKAFALIWSDVGSGGNRLRVAVEALMNERKIQKKAIIKEGKNKGKFRHLALHERIRGLRRGTKMRQLS